MLGRLRFNRSLGWSLLLAVGLLGFLSPAAGASASAAKPHGPLSPDLRRLAAPAVVLESDSQQAEALGVPTSGPGSLIREGRRVLVDVRFDSGALAHLGALRSAGATVASASRRYQAVTAAVLPAVLHQVAAIPGVKSVTAVPAPIVWAGECEGGSVISEGVSQINAQGAREAFAVDGEGVTVGVLSDSYDKSTSAATHAPEDVSSKDLPGLTNTCLGQQAPVDVRSDLSSPEATDEGRAMLQIVHDVAPDAKLAFASAFSGELAFAESIEELAKPVLSGGAGAKVIVDDISYFEEPFFQDGPVAAAVNKVTAEGVSYLSAAGNDNLIDGAGRDIASWEAPSFRDGGACPAVIAGMPGIGPTHCMDFDPVAATDKGFGITVEPEEELVLDLQWSEPWEGVETDLDAFLLNASGTTVLASATENNVGSQKPVELLFWKNPSATQSREVQLAIDHCFGECNPGASASKNPRLKFILLENGGGVSGTEYPESHGGDTVGPSVYGHAGSADAIAVGAVPFNNSGHPEPYSSRGPVRHFFGQVSGGGAAAALPPQTIAKPDVAATDCGRTTFFAFESSPGIWRFCGTSAAAPHAAGAVALMMQAGEGAGGGLEQPEPIRAALLKSASAVGSFGACAVGAGLVEAKGAVAALLAEPGAVPALACPPSEEGGGEEEGGETPPPTVPIPMPAGTPTPPAPPSTSPNTFFARHPPKLVRTRSNAARAFFRFSSDQAGTTFLCRIDRGAFRACGARIVHRFGLGRHVVRVKALGSTGLADPTPAVFRFRVEHVG